MSKKVLSPKGRKSLPQELQNFGVHLVYSEGTKTEPNYVKNIKNLIAQKYNCSPNDINIIPVSKESYNTIGLVKYAIDDTIKRAKNTHIDHVWIFFDKDDFPQDYFDSAINQIDILNDSENDNGDSFKYNKDTGISFHACYSNEAFELFLIQYFNYCDSILNRKNYIEKLDSILKSNGKPKYDKSCDKLHDLLTSCGGKIENAIKNSKKLTKNNNRSNPSTTVYLFAEYFLPYMKKDM